MGLSSLPSWVGYSESNLEGQQYILEEGEYPQPCDWGSSDSSLLSLRPVCTVSVRVFRLVPR